MSAISSVTTTSSTSSSSSSSSASGISANYEMFLSLLCTQLENQSPLDPMDAQTFTSQLVQYAGVEQQIQVNDKLESVLSKLDSFSFSSGVGYLGHAVEASGDTLSVGSDGSVGGSWKYTLPSEASSVTLTVTNSDGAVVWSGSGETASGSHTLTWDGKDANGYAVAAGDYTLTVAAKSSSGSTITASKSITGTVTGVDSSSGSTVFEIGATEVSMSDVTRLVA
ncbi:flagellar hook assembly protein FlgD [Novispirillum itersonii]|uniref:flagellar hook assembly protein FlgD n=1 Tax=Novispirillum itersonii TaxID=189 RepID=UPI00039D3E76|nr:flagellar hook capping FlgD N-terminal domain-containing protein [Novispirillum itersonii]